MSGEKSQATCPRCGEVKPTSEFSIDKSKASGRKSHCKLCDAERSRRYYEANRERKLAYLARYRERQGASR